MAPAVLYEKDGAIARIRLNRPQVHNALSPESIRLLDEIWQDFALDRALKVAILSGEGQSFCSGRDMKLTDLGFGWRQGDGGPDDERVATRPCERRRVNYVPPCDLFKPVIAAIHGVALGGGLELALSCDFRIGAEGSRYGLPEVTRGLIPGSGGLYWLPRVIGLGPAMEMALTGRLVDGAEALSLRLVNRLVAGDDLMTVAESLAQAIAANPSLAVQGVKEAIWRTLGSGPSEGLNVSEHQARVLRLSRDADEGARAFEEKRPPRYEGR